MILYRVFGFLIALAIGFLPATAEAARVRKAASAPSSGAYQNKPIALGATVWYCAYNRGTWILCQLGDPGSMAMTRPVQVIDPRLPALVHDIRNTPDLLADESIAIPLYSEPFAFDMVGELAESVMCGGQALCGVIFAESPWQLDQLVSAYENNRLASYLASLAGATKNTAGEGDREIRAVGEPGRSAYQYASAGQ